MNFIAFKRLCAYLSLLTATQLLAGPILEDVRGRAFLEEGGIYKPASNHVEVAAGRRLIMLSGASALLRSGDCKLNLVGPHIYRLDTVKACQEVEAENLRYESDLLMETKKHQDGLPKTLDLERTLSLDEGPLVYKGKPNPLLTHQLGNAGPE